MPIRQKPAEEKLERWFWKPVQKGAKFVATRNGETYECNEIEGKVGSIYTYFDEGRAEKDVDAHQKLVITLFDDDGVHQISAKSSTNFASSLASRVGQVNRGDVVRVSIRQGKKATVAFANIHILTETGEWVECGYVKLPQDLEEKNEKAIEIFAQHPAKSEYGGNEPQAE